MYQFEGITVSIVKRRIFACSGENAKCVKLRYTSRASILGVTRLTMDFELSDTKTTYGS
jgi:hypothetical protein